MIKNIKSKKELITNKKEMLKMNNQLMKEYQQLRLKIEFNPLSEFLRGKVSNKTLQIIGVNEFSELLDISKTIDELKKNIYIIINSKYTRTEIEEYINYIQDNLDEFIIHNYKVSQDIYDKIGIKSFKELYRTEKVKELLIEIIIKNVEILYED